MAVPSRSTKVKVTVGYTLLLAVLLFSLFFVQREVEKLSAADDRQALRTDSLMSLLREKDRNTIQMLRVLNEEANESTLSVEEIEEIIAEQDSVVTRQRVQHRVITKRDSVITKPGKKGFFKRLAEAFVPSKTDTAVLVNTAVEFATDTVIDAYNPTDSLQEKLRTASREKLEQKKTTSRNKVRYRRLDVQLTARIDSLLKGYEQEALSRSRHEAEAQQEMRRRSTRTLGGIAVGAVLLSGVFLIFIWRDITRSNRYRRELEEANRRAEELLEAREKLMLAITHDFKAPLGSIMGYADLLSRLTTDGRQRFYLDNMKSSSQHLLKLVVDLLDFHRLDLNKAEVNRVTFHPAQLFEEIRVSFEPLTAAKGLALRCDVAPELKGYFISDPLRIRQIVTNLLSNAVKFTSEGEISLEVSYQASRMRIEVADTGKGMEAADRERIFQEFTRLPGAQGEEGFGLGLSIVSKLVALLEGSIDVQSTPGRGSRFMVTLPLYPVVVDKQPSGTTGGTAEDVLPQPAGEGRTAKPANVLLIDDDRIQLSLTAAMLEQQGIHATCCRQLDELTEQLRSHPFDVLLTDVQMPAINGFDLLKLLRASNIPQARAIPVIAVTARSEMETADFRKHGFAGCLHKPFSVADLLALLGEAETPAPGEPSSSSSPSTPYRSPFTVHPSPFRLSALTAFSEDDEEAATAILHTFVEETEKNKAQLIAAFEAENVDGIAAMAHKLLPLFTLIEAREAAELLAWLEARRGSVFDEEIAAKVRKVVERIDEVLAATQDAPDR